jgi:PhzF family phenazine biosynthesis protein
MTLALVDAFADRPFTGNPAAVCVLGAPADPTWMQALAAEMNLAETAFVVPDGDAFGLRWFTPTVEVDLCGHATLASAHWLYESGALPAGTPARFDTRSGRLTVRRLPDGRLSMDFPATPPAAADAPEGLAVLLGAAPRWVGRSRFDLFVELPDEAAVRAVAPDASAIAALGARGLIVTAPASAGADYDVVSRFFAPGAGVPEDPVTGSAHCAIAPYWSARLGTDTLRCFQASARGGFVGTRVAADRVELTGGAVMVGHLTLSPEAQPPA